MKHAPSAFAAGVAKLAENATDEELEAWLEALPPCPGIRSVDDDADDDEIDAEIAAGDWVPHEIVAEWLETWGTTDRRPFDEWFAARNG